jgi:acetoacetyl-CoA synthetase
MVTGLLSGGTIVLYDGSPAEPDLLALWRVAEREAITVFGTSAAFVQACVKADLAPGAELELGSLRALASTGSPLSPAGFAWLQENVKSDIPIFSVSGGTDICSSFLSSSNLLPVHAGELQCRALGVSLQAFDHEGHAVVGEVGELVVDKPMPSMPVRLWNDETGERYRETYFSMYPGVWRHGDWVTVTEQGSAIIHGRSDATLNRGGIRMGSSEFYQVVEALPEIADSLVVEDGADATTARLLLFVVTSESGVLDDELRKRIRDAIRTDLSPRHLPDEILAAPSIPRTLNGKKLEVPVKRVLQGVPLSEAASTGSVLNPDALEYFARLGASRAEVGS